PFQDSAAQTASSDQIGSTCRSHCRAGAAPAIYDSWPPLVRTDEMIEPVAFAALHMSARGTKRTCRTPPAHVREADLARIDDAAGAIFCRQPRADQSSLLMVARSLVGRSEGNL